MGEGFDGRRVDDAHLVARLIKKEREGFAVSASGFEASVDALDTLLGEPLQQLLAAGRGVRKDFMLELAALVDETEIEL